MSYIFIFNISYEFPHSCEAYYFSLILWLWAFVEYLSSWIRDKMECLHFKALWDVVVKQFDKTTLAGFVLVRRSLCIETSSNITLFQCDGHFKRHFWVPSRKTECYLYNVTKHYLCLLFQATETKSGPQNSHKDLWPS